MTSDEIREIIKQNGGKILYDYVRGSHVYGLNTETSDIDTSFVYASPYNEIIGLRSNYKEQISDDKSDNVGYEVGRYLELLEKSNPNMIESLFIPDKFILSQDPIMKLIFDHRNEFLSKNALRSLSGYAYDQINKAVGLNKKCVQPVMNKKTPIDFCYTFKEQGSEPVTKFLERHGLKQIYCGLVHIDNMDQAYAVFYDWGQHIHMEWKTAEDFAKFMISIKGIHFIEDIIFNFDKSIYEKLAYERGWDEKENQEYNYQKYLKAYKEIIPKGYHGIQKEDGSSNSIHLDSILKGEQPIFHLLYNKNGYETHCKKYKEHKDWEKNRNEARYQNNLGHNYDSKNMMHCIRLLTMAVELGKEGKFILDRNSAGDRDYLMSIRNHKFPYEEIKNKADLLKKEVDELINTSSLPDKVDHEAVNNLLIEIRTKIYG